MTARHVDAVQCADDPRSVRGGGIGLIANVLRMGVNVSLGTDGPMVDYSVDIVEQMKACMLMEHVRHLDHTCVPVERTIEMATINSAKVLGFEAEIGSLGAGRSADIAIFDLKKPYVGVLHRLISAFVCAGKGSDVRTVIVNGDVVYLDGRFMRFGDYSDVIGEAERIGRVIPNQVGSSHRLAPA